MKVRVNTTKRHANQANVVPILSSFLCDPNEVPNTKRIENDDDDESPVCVVTQSHFRDKKGRLLFASCTFVRLDDL